MNNAHIYSANPDDEFFFDEGCYILELLNDPASPAMSIARATVKAGVTTRLHRLNGVDERYVVIEGEGMVEVAGHPPQILRVGDVAEIPRGETQRIRNSAREDLVFLAICTPRFTADCYEDVDPLVDPASE